MSEPNFDALGRYTEAAERAREALRRRNDALYRLAGRASAAAEGDYTGFIGRGVDCDKLRAALNDAEKANAEMIAAIADANAAAIESGKQALKLA